MKLRISDIRDAGNLDKERVVINVLSATDVGRFLLLQTGLKDSGTVTNKVRFAFWFPDKKVSAGDFVILYTKKGSNTEAPFKEVKSHFFYWGLEDSIWATPNRSAVLLDAPEWESFKLSRD